MLYGMYLSATGMAMNQSQQDVIANNLANVDTAGFKRDLSIFKQRLQEAKGINGQFLPANLKEATGGAFAANVQTDYTQGGVEHTNRNLDLAIEGPGFLTVQDGETTRYTRDGRLGLADGKLVRQIDGKPLLDDAGKEIVLPSDTTARDIRIDSQGNVWDKTSQVGKLGVVTFDQPRNLVKIGGNLFDAMGQDAEKIDPQIDSGTIETSTVNPASEMVEMIKTSRSFQMNAAMITLQDQSLAKLVSELPKL
ncbi:MAG: flagellar hook-basal body protein [Phycisphaerae bacterium]